MNQAGLALLKSFENCRLYAYADLGGVLTIGWGHTAPDLKSGDTCTQDQADQWLLEDISHVEEELGHMVIGPVTENMMDALTCLAFNIGVGAFHQSTLLKFVNDGDREMAASQFPRWDHVNGIEVQGLLRRREAERDLFLTV